MAAGFPGGEDDRLSTGQGPRRGACDALYYKKVGLCLTRVLIPRLSVLMTSHKSRSLSVQKLLKDEGDDALGGKMRHATVLFSDIRGFSVGCISSRPVYRENTGVEVVLVAGHTNKSW